MLAAGVPAVGGMAAVLLAVDNASEVGSDATGEDGAAGVRLAVALAVTVGLAFEVVLALDERLVEALGTDLHDEVVPEGFPGWGFTGWTSWDGDLRVHLDANRPLESSKRASSSVAAWGSIAISS